MAGISDLLNWKREVTITKQDGGTLAKIWIRLIGDFDLQEAYRQSRIASSKKRAALRDPESFDYQDEIQTLEAANEIELKNLIRTSAENTFLNDAIAKINRDELPKMEEIAVEPDGPTLEEQERLDVEEEKVDTSYRDKIDEYTSGRLKVLNAELDEMTREELVERAKVEYVAIAPMSVFINELEAQKLWRAVYKEKDCKNRMYASIDDYRAEYQFIKTQLSAAYAGLEIEPDEVKN